MLRGCFGGLVVFMTCLRVWLMIGVGRVEADCLRIMLGTLRPIPRAARNLMIPRAGIFKHGCPKLGQDGGLGSGAEAFGSKASSRDDPDPGRDLKSFRFTSTSRVTISRASGAEKGEWLAACRPHV